MKRLSSAVATYTHVYFAVEYETSKTTVWSCRNLKSDAVLGYVKWYGPWRQYCFVPEVDTVFSRSCMVDIENFIHGQMIDRAICKKAAYKEEPCGT